MVSVTQNNGAYVIIYRHQQAYRIPPTEGYHWLIRHAITTREHHTFSTPLLPSHTLSVSLMLHFPLVVGLPHQFRQHFTTLPSSPSSALITPTKFWLAGSSRCHFTLAALFFALPSRHHCITVLANNGRPFLHAYYCHSHCCFRTVVNYAPTVSRLPSTINNGRHFHQVCNLLFRLQQLVINFRSSVFTNIEFRSSCHH